MPSDLQVNVRRVVENLSNIQPQTQLQCDQSAGIEALLSSTSPASTKFISSAATFWSWLLDSQADKTIVGPDSRECAGKYQDLLLGTFSHMLDRMGVITMMLNRHLTSRMFVFFPTLLGREYLVEK